MSKQDSVCPFFQPKHLQKLESDPKGSVEWEECLDLISLDIKNFEIFLCNSGITSFSFENDEFEIDLRREGKKCYICHDGRPLIQNPIEKRLEIYQCFPEIYMKSLVEIRKIEEGYSYDGVDKSVFDKIKESFEKVSSSIWKTENLSSVVNKLKDLRNEMPEENAAKKDQYQWLKELASTIFQLNNIEKVIKSILNEMPSFWSSLSIGQKILIASFMPIIGGGLYLGAIGIAGGGGAVGVPVFIVILLMLFVLGGMTTFLDYIISFLERGMNVNYSYDEIGKAMNNAIDEIFMKTFAKTPSFEHKEMDNNKEYEDHRKFEFEAVEYCEEHFKGKGVVTRQSSDFGVDGYIMCENEVILVQAKLYNRKIGFGEVVEYLGVYHYWKKMFEEKLPSPITKMVIVSRTDFSIEAKKVAKNFDFVVLLKI